MALKDITVGQIADLIKDARKGGPKGCLLIGAGVSKTAGIGLANDFVTRIREDYPEIYSAICVELGGKKEPGYAQCMAALPPAKQVQLVREDIDRARINWAHIGIARLECAEIIDSILTTNFDPLASRACALFHRFPAIYDLAGLRDDSTEHIDFDRSYVKGSAIFHLHGQHTGFLLLNTPEKLLNQAKRIRPVLDATMKGKPIIVAGYSGGVDPLVAEIAALAPFNHGLFWVCHDDADPAPNICDKLLHYENCRLVRNMPADRFFTDLANALKLEAPKFMFNPFQHMLGVLNTIECYSSERSSPQDDLLAQAKAEIQAAANMLEEERASQSDIAKLMSAGRYEEVWEQFHTETESLSDHERQQVAWAALHVGRLLAGKAMEKKGEEAAALHALSSERFSDAVLLRPDLVQAIQALGISFVWRASLAKGKKRRALLNEAEKRLLQTESMSSGLGAYDLACVYGLRGDAQTAATWLVAAKKKNVNFPGCRYVASDKDFDSI